MWSADGDDNRFRARRMFGRASELYDAPQSVRNTAGDIKQRPRRVRQEDVEAHFLHTRPESLPSQQESLEAVRDAIRSCGTPALHGSCELVRDFAHFCSQESRPSFAGKGPKGWTRSDERIRDEVNEVLARHELVDPSELEVDVLDGEVTLTGTVADDEQMDLAQGAIGSVLGVREVHSDVRITRVAETETSHE